MEGYVGEIRMFAANFAPMSWQLCAGQLLPMRQNMALYSLIGFIYGGDGQTTFALPDLRGRTIVGTGQGTGLSKYTNGQNPGVENVMLTSSQIPVHSHIAAVSAGPNPAAQVTVYGTNGVSSSNDPAGNLPGQDDGDNVTMYASSGTLIPMAANAIQAKNVTGPKITAVNLGIAGSSSNHSNIQPSLVINYIICYNGLYPSRN